ncbi:SGNH/GDSL hydrolase family protein [Dyadobacter sp. CY327]|uniref:SGNH/GDSL hydrolase family protein n=1 Tax=Dyadobacter sp. CY327 TaxID=2907301 RepID=UPI001F4630A3|nr:SGNH/GDSL hydrolase family protein [Dyadobacter sp. CY327]MCE7071027.1 SGNH/GDSL hydrolase family protein [Dyadobacter sp. CY327]
MATSCTNDASICDSRLFNLQAILQTAEGALKSNLRTREIMTSPPTITSSSTVPAGLTKSYFPVVSGALNPASPFLITGGTPKVLSGAIGVDAATMGPTGGNLGNGEQGTLWRIILNSDATQISFLVQGYSIPYRFIVNGQYVTAGTSSSSVGGNEYLTLTFANSQMREIAIESGLGYLFIATYVGPTFSIWKPTTGKRVVFVGDSFTETTGATFAPNGYARVAGDFLGVKDVVASGVGGTGYTNNASTKYTFLQRLQDWTTNDPDMVVFAGGINDANDALLEPAVSVVLRETRRILPAVPILVLGAWSGSSGPSATIIGVENKIKAAVTAINDPYIRFIPVSTDTRGAWISGTGRVGAPNGTGNSDIYTSSDGIHPANEGHFYLGYRVAVSIYDTVFAMVKELVTT